MQQLDPGPVYADGHSLMHDDDIDDERGFDCIQVEHDLYQVPPPREGTRVGIFLYDFF